MKEEKKIGYIALPKNQVVNFEVGKEYNSTVHDYFKNGFRVERQLLNLIFASDISIHKIFMVECSEIDEMYENKTSFPCKHIKLIKKYNFEYIVENIDVYLHDTVEKLVITCNKEAYGRITNTEDNSTIFMNGVLGVVNNTGLFGIINIDGFRNTCNLANHNNIAISNGKTNIINSAGSCNTIFLRGGNNILSVNGGFSNVISNGTNSNISCVSDSNRIICNGENNVVYLYGKNNKVNAKSGTTIIYSERNNKNEGQPTTVKTIYVDGTDIKADTWYIIENGEIKECDK